MSIYPLLERHKVCGSLILSPSWLNMAAHPSVYALTRASQQDIHQIVKLLFESFDDFARANYFGTSTQDDLPKLATKYADIMSNDSADVWMKIEDTATGTIVAACNWKLYLGPETAQPRVRDEPVPWLVGEAAEKQRLLLEPMNEARARANPGPFMCACSGCSLCTRAHRGDYVDEASQIYISWRRTRTTAGRDSDLP